MTAIVPDWAAPCEASVVATDTGGADPQTVVLIDAVLLREHDEVWVHEIESTLGSVVAICANPGEADWARAHGVRRAAPASILRACSDVALDILADIVATQLSSRSRLERFMRDAVHEFRTPLTVISEFVGLCQDGVGGPLTERQEDYLGYIKGAVERMGEQFDDYRDGLLMHLGTLEQSPSTGNLAQIVEQAAISMDALYVRNTDLSAVRLEQVDSQRLTEAVKRLIGGAMKLAAKGEQVEVELVSPSEASSSCVEVHVRYRGVVLSEEDVTVMEEGLVIRSNGFYRSVARVFGLGVSMARMFLSQSGATTCLELAEGVGGSFIARFPIKGDAMSHSRPGATPGASQARGA